MFRNGVRTLVLVVILVLLPAPGFSASTTISMRLLYPSFAGSWATAWIAKEAGYFSSEGLDVELIRVGGSTRMVAAMLGGSAPIIQAGASAGFSGNRCGR
jgi:ABC-type nitrate/sulfonate/bicarbonate transport system substrate-binding protein